MPKQEIAYDEYFQQVNKILGSTGLLLAAGAPDKPTNAMAIGWGGPWASLGASPPGRSWFGPADSPISL